jgi:beta-glucanase (GH16 family)
MKKMKNIVLISVWAFYLVTSVLPGCTKKNNTDNFPDNPNTGKKVLVWADEFDYNGLPNANKWSYDTAGNAGGWGNNELQFYTKARLSNVEVKNGYLTITARKEDYKGFKYTSARLITKEKGDWLYGRMEIKAKLPDGRGMWPAIWMLPTDWAYGGWPKSGEIDIMENVGYDPFVIVASAHTESYNHVLGTQKGNRITINTCYSDFHVYALEWEAKEYRVYVDDTLYFTFKNEGTGYKVWPFDKRFHLLLNIAVGGNWGGQQGIDDSVFPRSMIVDYVRVYEFR